MKKLYSLEANGREIVSVEMDVPDFVPRTTLDRKWLKGIITEEVSAVTKPRRSRLARKPSRHVKPVKVHA